MVKMIGFLIVLLVFSQALSVVSLKQSYLNEGRFLVFFKDHFRNLICVSPCIINVGKVI